MFSKRVVSSTRFLKLPHTSRLLYYDLGMEADDDGVVEAWQVMKVTGSNEEDLRLLVERGFIVVLNPELVCYIIDWHEHNLIRSDRKINSVHLELLVSVIPNVLIFAPSPRADTGKITGSSSLDVRRTADGQLRLGKGRLGEVNSPPTPSRRGRRTGLGNMPDRI